MNLKKSVRYLFIVMVAWILLHSLVITIDGLNDNLHKADCILVLGNTVNKDGTLSNRLQSRVEKGFELYNLKFASKIIVSGGLGKEGYYEAREMKTYLLKKGVPTEDILLDDKGLTTYETMCNYIPLAKQHNLNSVIIVSQFYHLHRSRAMIKSLGVQNYYTAHSNYFELRDFYSVLREFFAYYVFLVS